MAEYNSNSIVGKKEDIVMLSIAKKIALGAGLVGAISILPLFSGIVSSAYAEEHEVCFNKEGTVVSLGKYTITTRSILEISI